VIESVWGDSTHELLGRSEVPAAQATGRLLADTDARWRDRVEPRTSMHDLLFTVPGQVYPFEDTVRVSWAHGVFEFRPTAKRGKLVTPDRCHEANAPLVLDAFHARFVGDASLPVISRWAFGVAARMGSGHPQRASLPDAGLKRAGSRVPTMTVLWSATISGWPANSMRWRTDWRSSHWPLDMAATAFWPVPRNDEVPLASLRASSLRRGWPCRPSVDTHDCRIS
jgi:hypothetical protein